MDEGMQPSSLLNDNSFRLVGIFNFRSKRNSQSDCRHKDEDIV